MFVKVQLVNPSILAGIGFYSLSPIKFCLDSQENLTKLGAKGSQKDFNNFKPKYVSGDSEQL